MFNEVKIMHNFIPGVEKSLQIIFQDKMVSDGFFDASRYIECKEIKESIYRRLMSFHSVYSNLFFEKNIFPKSESDIFKTWETSLGLGDDNKTILDIDSINEIEADAIVYWLLSTYRSKADRESFLIRLLNEYKSLYKIASNSKIENGVVYNELTIKPFFIDNLSSFTQVINTLYDMKEEVLFFRGHSDSNFKLIPSLFRDKEWEIAENKMFSEIIERCPSHFTECRSNFERLVEMQHFGTPTRLLDITMNPYVALYFSAKQNFETNGEVVLLKSNGPIYNSSSAMVTVISNLAKVDYDLKIKFLTSTTSSSSSEFYTSLENEIKREYPAFSQQISDFNLKSCFYVSAELKNERIKNQDGAFIMCGLVSEDIKKYNLNNFRLVKENRIQVLFVSKNRKREILAELDRMSFNEVRFFPGIESTSVYIKEKYRHKLQASGV